MKKTIQSILTVTLTPVTVLVAGISLTNPVLAKPAAQTPAIKQVERCTLKTCTFYRVDYERAIANGMIDRPSWVDDEELAIQLAYDAIDQGDRYEATIRFAQALVLMSEKHGSTKALDYEQYVDTKLQREQGQTLREYLPMFGRIFPQQSERPLAHTSYKTNYERAIANGLIDRPSRVYDEQEAIDLGFEAMAQGDRYEAAIRFAQALVLMSEKYDSTTALDFEQNLDSKLWEERGQTLREYLPMFGRIFPVNNTAYR
jgi:tetratricopeptide (TPR) repeat protein